MGTPDFAVLPLKSIIEAGYDVLAVVTAPDRPAGRGRKLKHSAVKAFSVANNLKILQPEKLRDDAFVQELKALVADVFVVVAFRMLPEIVWRIPTKGTFNLHASLLPQYRGAAPINWAIINGEKETGVTTFFINEEIDAGALLLQKTVGIQEGETAGTLHDKLMQVGASLVVDTLDGIENENLRPTIQQIDEDLKAAPKIFKEDCKIDWAKSGEEIERLIRGLSPYPCAFTTVEDGGDIKNLKILNARFIAQTHENKVATLEVLEKELVIWIRGGYIKLIKLQPEGKRAMMASDYINGMPDKKASFQVK